MRARTSLWASMAIAASLGLAGCGGSSDNNEEAGTQPPADPKVDVSEKISLSKAQMAALLAVLPGTGDSVTLESGEIRAGVTFTCASGDDPCSITVENSAGTIVAMAHSTTAGEVSGTAAGLARDVVDTFARLNDGNANSIRIEVVGSADDSSTVPPNMRPTEVIGMEIGGPGVLPSHAAGNGGLRSDFQANGARLAGSPNNTIAAPGAPLNLQGGTTITIATDLIPASDDMAPAPDGWDMRVLFRDWGDTAGDGDGGFETGAIVLTDLEEGTPYPFDRKLHDRYVNEIAQDMFDLSIRADGSQPGVTTLATSVHINGDDPNNTDEGVATSAQWAAMEFHTDSLVAAQSQDLRIDEDETFRGTYFGAPGQFRCLGTSDARGEDCALARVNGKVVVHDTDPDKDKVDSTGRWSFTPDEGAMITVPDQDWIVYGAWLTTPDGTNGDHRLGVVFNGMDPYEPAENSFDASDEDGLRGSATYKGGATGIYVDGEDSGLFTADATLTAHFDSTRNGTDRSTEDQVDGATRAADTNDYSISGRIDNFRGTDGVFLGSDTEATPNDPDAGGENDWVVLLNKFEFPADADDADAAAMVIAGSDSTPLTTSGSADGVGWEGRWNGMFFGPSTDADDDPTHPSGVAGQFWAETNDPLIADVEGPPAIDASTRNPRMAVVGTFGATK